VSTIGFIGLGIMGGPMARHLVTAGHTVVGYDRSEERMQALVESGGGAADSIEQTVKNADIVAIMVPDSPDVQAVLLPEDGVFAHAQPGTLVIDFSSIRPDITAELAKTAVERGLRISQHGCRDGLPREVLRGRSQQGPIADSKETEPKVREYVAFQNSGRSKPDDGVVTLPARVLMKEMSRI